jgi:poly(3-hydroxybutyrate) depolymerase
MNDSIPSGASSYKLADPRPGPARQIEVHLHKPLAFRPDMPILMVLHGRKRNGAEYRDYFTVQSKRRGFVVVAPEFPEPQYAHPHTYNYGEMVDERGLLLPRERWIFPVLGKVFEDARRRLGSTRERFFVFGHSAGAQLVHRMATFGWIDSIERAIAANAGSYTMPVRGEAFPFGLDDTRLGDGEVRALFSRPLTIFLGDRDTDPNDEHLPREPAAMRQGPYRFARGQNYFETAKHEAERLGAPFAWRLAIAPGVAHSGEHMAPFAAQRLFERPSES